MKKGKILIVFLLVFCMAASLIGCSKKEDQKEPEKAGDTGDTGDTETTDETFYGNIVIGKYKGIEVTKQDTSVTDQDIEYELSSFINSITTLDEVEDSIKDGDVANIDYVGTIDGVAFDRGSDKGYNLTIGAGGFIEGFEEQLIGVNAGDTVDINVTFPDPYQNNTELSGKPAVFTVTVNYVKRYNVPELTDELVAEKTDSDTVEDFKVYITEQIKTRNETNAINMMNSDAIQAIIDDSEISDIPDEIVASIRSEYNSRYEEYAAGYQIDLETFLTYFFNMSLDIYNQELDSMALFAAKQQLILSEVIKLENLILTEDEYNKEIQEYIEMYQFESKEEFESMIGREKIEENILMDKAMQLIQDNLIIS